MTYISLIQPIYDYNSTSKWLVSAVSDTKEKYIDLKKKKNFLSMATNHWVTIELLKSQFLCPIPIEACFHQ